MTTDGNHTAPRPSSLATRPWVWAPLILAGIVLCSKLPQLQRSPSIGQDSPATGKPAPKIDLVSLATATPDQSIRQLPPGKVVLIHFWGTWCGPCLLEYPELAEMVATWNDSSRFQFVSISCEADSTESFDGLRRQTLEYLESIGADHPTYCDPKGMTRRSAADRMEREVVAYPTTLLIGPDGLIAGVWVGANEYFVTQMHEAITYLVNR